MSKILFLETDSEYNEITSIMKEGNIIDLIREEMDPFKREVCSIAGEGGDVLKIMEKKGVISNDYDTYEYTPPTINPNTGLVEAIFAIDRNGDIYDRYCLKWIVLEQ